MFKKTLLAVSIAAISTGAFAVNVTSESLEHTNEGVQTATLITAAPATATLKAAYKQDDLIKFTFSQDLHEDFVAAVTITGALSDATGALTLGKIDQSGNTVTYRVTEATFGGGPGDATTTIDATVGIEAVNFSGAALRTAGSATVNWSATLSNGTTPIDQASGDDEATVEIVNLNDQFATSVVVDAELDGVIDVENNRVTFEGDQSADTLEFELVETILDIAAENAALESVTYTVNGSFSYLDTDAVTAGIQLGTNTVTVNAGLVDSVTADSIVVSHNVDTSIILTIDNVEEGVIPTQSFSVDAVVEYTDADDAVHESASANDAAGSWTINGSEVTFPYAPIGYDHIVTQFEIANSGAQDGDITLTAFDTEGTPYSALLDKKATAGTITSIGFKELIAAFGLTEGTKLSVTITTTAPANDIKITGYSNLNGTGRMALLSDAYEGKINTP
ncbi:MAG: hypothetical protein ACI9VT_000014 [Psychroserpens sp.]|jgi:hypothetical protein